MKFYRNILNKKYFIHLYDDSWFFNIAENGNNKFILKLPSFNNNIILYIWHAEATGKSYPFRFTRKSRRKAFNKRLLVLFEKTYNSKFY